MIIDFKEIPEKSLEHFKGGEKAFDARMYVDGGNKIMRGRLQSGASIGLHTHENDCEVIFIAEGRGTVLMDGVYEDVSAGLCHYCPKGHSHSLINNSDSDLLFSAVVAQQ